MPGSWLEEAGRAPPVLWQAFLGLCHGLAGTLAPGRLGLCFLMSRWALIVFWAGEACLGVLCFFGFVAFLSQV